MAEAMRTPSYLALLEGGELRRRANEALELLKHGGFFADRLGDGASATPDSPPCDDGTQARLHSCGPLHDGESCLRGGRGSAAIFPSGCDLRCVGCQNWRTRWVGGGIEVQPDELAALMLQLQAMGYHNVNLINPGRIVVPFLQALAIAAENGLHIPIIYTSCGYESLARLRLLESIVDIYILTLKYSDPGHAHTYSQASNYVDVSRSAAREMHRQVGDLVLDLDGLARRGLIVRHLVLPNGIAGADDTFRFVARNISTGTAVNVRHDYEPRFRTRCHPAMDRQPSRQEVAEAVRAAARHGLYRFDKGSLAHRFLARS